jgi:phage major head subunit gpT-like protein
MIISQANLDALRLTLSMAFQGAYDSTEPAFSRLTSVLPSSTASTRYGWLAQQVMLREWIGPRVALNLAERTHVVVNRKFEATIQIPRDQLEDDNLGMYAGVMVPQLAQAVKKHADQLTVTLLALSSGAGPVTFDGSTLFADAHPNFNVTGAGATTYDNNFALALDAANFNTVWSTMAAYIGENGQPLGVMPNLLIVPPQLRKAALELMNASMTVGSNIAGGSNVLQGWCDVLVVPELAASATQWFLADVSKPIKPLGYQVRRAPEFVSRDSLTDPNVFDQELFTYGCSYRGEVFPTLPFLIARGNV